ncbi:condensation domain-containing protein, partial [Lysinibacillus fusiformis]|uniref:condensation domain-containing protein n=1 Tax=Lysinibacillus fusiformis TaxID=28031 RepID=UPI0038186BA6
PDPNSGGKMQKEYVAPRNELEQTIAHIWEELLDAPSIGIHDNFFELGGDSIKGIQLMAKLRTHGISLEVKQLIKFPTIEQLMSCIKESDIIDQDEVLGEIQLTPIQHYFLELTNGNLNHFNQSVFVKRKKPFDADMIRRTIQIIVNHHDALRVTFNGTAQVNQPIQEIDCLEVMKLTEIKEDEIMAKLNYLQESFCLESGPLIKVCLFQTKAEDHLFIMIHHFVVDGISWRIIFEDFIKIYECLENGETAIHLPPKTHSFKTWSEVLNEYASKTTLLEQKSQWEEILMKPVDTIIADFQITNRSIKTQQICSFTLSEDETTTLIKTIPNMAKMDINTILLTAFIHALHDWKGLSTIQVTLESHGRTHDFEGIDISRTVAWFTTLYPINLSVHPTNIQETLVAVQESLQSISNNGIDYGVLKYLSKYRDELLAMPLKEDVTFNYLGTFDQQFAKSDLAISHLPKGQEIDEVIDVKTKLVVNSFISQGQFELTIMFDQHEFNQETIVSLSEMYKNRLMEFIQMANGNNFLTLKDDLIKTYYQQPDVSLLNEKKDKNLFVFPPHMPKVGYSILYKNLSSYVEDYSFYMFNFIESFDFVNIYADMIEQIDQDGSYVLMGYSFGGSIAIEVAHELIRRGHQVTDVILIDSYVIEQDSFESFNVNLIRGQADDYAEGEFASFVAFDPSLKEMIVESFVTYYNYTKDLVTTLNSVGANIHMIKTKEAVSFIKSDTRSKWESLSSKQYDEYEGVGAHNEMLGSKYLHTNALILVTILEGISNKLSATQEILLN